MLHLLHPSLPRAAALDPYRVRHHVLVAAASVITLTLLLGNGVSTALAVAAEQAEESSQPAPQLFVTAPEGAVAEAVAPAAAASLSAATDGATGEVPADETPAAEADALDAAAPSARPEFTIDVRPPVMYPVGSGAPVGSPFGPRDRACGACSTQHQGVDWNPGRGTPIVAMADGVVSKVVTSGSTLGVYLIIDHVVNGQAISSVYGHMENGSLTLRVGDEVRVGDQVGRVGSTGVTTAPHLHFELRIGGSAINPLPWLAANGAQ
ncbi:M23 family metallopeptidase [Microcella humidisoli]|uniref:M23 family metallopeptidase n=1 Tax=Microcella humidisoli TaxID=2963406 RepID=A0ABY5FUM4_9MICO|nr:M23 family metallopeptidase [Microcella humidisoli]UTT61871.1 M23 family metallopeptidase [Microcella humidisoli]